MAAHYGRIGIAGAGAWGTALTTVARRQGREVVIWAREAVVVEAINKRAPQHDVSCPKPPWTRRSGRRGIRPRSATPTPCFWWCPGSFYAASASRWHRIGPAACRR